MTDLEKFIHHSVLIDTHEHMGKEPAFVDDGPDILCDLFATYIRSDLASAGASADAEAALTDKSNADIAGRFAAVQTAWDACKHTGYGEAVRINAKDNYGLDELTPEALAKANEKALAMHKPGERLRILKDANLDHIQTDDFCWQCPPDASGPEFFLYDLGWCNFCQGSVDLKMIHDETKVEVTDLESLRQAMTDIFAKHGPTAIAVKSQHAYGRTLCWQKRSDADAEKVLKKSIAGKDLELADRLCLGDWCWARGVELAIEHNLPFKLHTGYYAGNNRMPVDFIRAGNLCSLLAEYGDCRFVLMHISYPYNDELVALVKHYANTYVDFCWAWCIDPYSSADFLRRMIHAAPANKMFGFGGDTGLPNQAAAYAKQARRWIGVALQGEVNDGYLSETDAIKVAARVMYENQRECFDIEGTRANIRAAIAANNAA